VSLLRGLVLRVQPLDLLLLLMVNCQAAVRHLLDLCHTARSDLLMSVPMLLVLAAQCHQHHFHITRHRVTLMVGMTSQHQVLLVNLVLATSTAMSYRRPSDNHIPCIQVMLKSMLTLRYFDYHFNSIFHGGILSFVSECMH